MTENTKFKNYKGYLGNVNIKRAGVKLEWTPEMVQEYSKCYNDPIYFAEKYMNIITADGDMIKIELYPYQKNIINSIHENRRTIVLTARQAGKALPLDTPIATPNGWKTMAHIEPGDIIFDENGQETSVRSISKIFYNHDCYKITFDDGSTVNADADHLWTVYKSSSRDKKSLNKTTKELFDSGVLYEDTRGKVCSKWKIPLTKPVQYKKKDVLIDPYTLGVWLGDGESASGRICGLEEDINFYKSNIPYKFSHNHSPDKNLYTGTLYGLSNSLRKLGILNNKRIPREYLFNDVSTRIALLQGLMDTDGWIEKSGQNGICFSTKNIGLIDDVYELLTSLGLKVFRKKYENTNSERLYFHCSKEMFEVFKLPRKLDKQIAITESKEYVSHRYIRNIEKIDSVPTKCIEVSNESHLFLCSKHYIPTHNTTAVAAYILWFILFNKNKNVAILGNTGIIAREILKRVQDAYEALPKWIQQGVAEWNKGTVEFENKCRILAGATTKSTIRGFTIHLMFIDEVAFVDNWEEFFKSVFNTMSNSKKNKICMVSTPNGMNHFHAYWEGAINRDKPNGWNPIKVTWKDVPGRDEAWKQEILHGTNFDIESFSQEHECEFLGSSGTLIAGWKLKELQSLYNIMPLQYGNHFYQYIRPEKEHRYVIICDVSRGKGLDYSTMQVIDTTSVPYIQVAIFKDNMITPLDFADMIFRTAKNYNDAFVLVEINDIGSQVSESIYYDFEYDHILMTENNGRSGKMLTAGFGSKEKDFGIRTTNTVKHAGCALLKLILEQGKLILNDKHTLKELETFSRKNKTYEAEPGKHDDLVMPLVLFAWMTDQQYFKDMTDINTLQLLREKSEEQMELEMSPFGIINDGMDYVETDEIKTVPSLDRWLFS